MKEDKPNLFIGKLIGKPSLQGRVMSFDSNNMELQILQIKDKRYLKYLDVGQIYSLFRHQGWDETFLLWEIRKKLMKSQDLQLILEWVKDEGWTWDLDWLIKGSY